MVRPSFDKLKWWQQATLMVTAIALFPIISVGLIVGLLATGFYSALREFWDEYVSQE